MFPTAFGQDLMREGILPVVGQVRAFQVKLVVKNHLQCRRLGFDPWVRKITLEEGMANHSIMEIHNAVCRFHAKEQVLLEDQELVAE